MQGFTLHLALVVSLANVLHLVSSIFVSPLLLYSFICIILPQQL